MKYVDLNSFIKNNDLLKEVKKEPGVYAITVDNWIAYIGPSRDMYQRCSQHIYDIQNAMLNADKMSKILLAAELGRT